MKALLVFAVVLSLASVNGRAQEPQAQKAPETASQTEEASTVPEADEATKGSNIATPAAAAGKLNPQAEIARITAPQAASNLTLQAAFPELLNQGERFSRQYFKEHKEDIMDELANHEVEFTYFKIDSNLSLTFMQELLSGKGQDLVIQKDHRSYKTVEVNGKAKKVGYLIRIEARLTTLQSKVDVSSLFAMGMAAKLGQTKGTLSVKVYGLSGEPIVGLLPSPADLSEGSIQSAIESVALIRSKLYEDGVLVIPQELKDPPVVQNKTVDAKALSKQKLFGRSG